MNNSTPQHEPSLIEVNELSFKRGASVKLTIPQTMQSTLYMLSKVLPLLSTNMHQAPATKVLKLNVK